MFRKPVRILLEISSAEDVSEGSPAAHTIGITLESGTCPYTFRP